MNPCYTVNKTACPPALADAFDGPAWAAAACGVVSNFREESSDHRPAVRFRLLHNDTHLFVRFQVADRYVRSVQTAYMSSVCGDSCTEFFVRPRPGKGYFNFEVNAGGTLLLSYIEDPSRSETGHGFKKWEPVTATLASGIEIWHSLPSVVDPEITEPVDWGNGWIIPATLFEAYVGPLGPLSGQTWRANFYKCGDRTSHRHWASWAPVSRLNFHLPECYGDLNLA
jgi:hypothetical protein